MRGRGGGADDACEIGELGRQGIESAPAAEQRESDEGATGEEEKGFRDPDSEAALAIGGAGEELERGVVRDVLADEPREGEEVEEEKGGGEKRHARGYVERPRLRDVVGPSPSPPPRLVLLG